ncbi:helix-turn-helix domain-containing protein [Streptomyces acidiscabies]|uniref:Helix-turn-helix transcriptional regulator n=1 Tax=Streptomyces acidiscabies TaxID=42234 RepID=A0AAP6BF50_9ACTN|nr:helix-turn-helix transcriptional regulator [Streptomyces acidiscabies]MBP5936874.1 helix-turn-helix domain-containing protein [Streptomyces sp. LBUM 1476]MBZ3915110.1 helix-turn-helix domain-containing protein [Streptomyces acidiscabies]MDX2963613.1 helix-turn-helix transcriptional regulator [Streptomyces acidiscabies]MDX3021172.1 helix-turn-helix transcriptional regulator [Streptomyces acidiscabies]MDX3794771.1 helix-turn-helix transcriptional regulator [Streptomyces acidiscabies]
MPDKPNPTFRQRRLARTLRGLRTAAGLTHADVAKVLGSAESKIGRIENYQSGIRLPDLRALLDAYNVTNPTERAALEKLAREAKQKGWWNQHTDVIEPAYATYAAVESDASEIYNVETSMVPGLLQIPDYTEALIRLQAPDATEEEIKTGIEVRRERKNILTRDNPLRLWVIITESVLYHQVAGPEVMRAQLESLIEAGRKQNIELQVLPREDPLNACLVGPFVIMSFPGVVESDLAYTEAATTSLFHEEEKDVQAYTTLFRRLNVAAANISKSRALIQDAINHVKDQ